MNLKDRFANPRRKVTDEGSNRDTYDRLSYENLYDKVCQLQERLDKFETKLSGEDNAGSS